MQDMSKEVAHVYKKYRFLLEQCKAGKYTDRAWTRKYGDLVEYLTLMSNLVEGGLLLSKEVDGNRMFSLSKEGRRILRLDEAAFAIEVDGILHQDLF